VTTSYDVRVYKTEVYKGKRKTTHYVRWVVAKRPFKRPHGTAALADSFRAELVSAARRGEAFRVDDGLPVSLSRVIAEVSWFDFACDFVDVKWTRAAATYRRSIAEALVTVTAAMLDGRRGRPDDRVLRAALFRWAFNTQRREAPAPGEIAEALGWARGNSPPVSELARPETLRRVLDAIATRLDGKVAAATVINRKRAVLYNAAEYAVERRLLDRNPVPELRWKAPPINHEVDDRSVVNPVQARTLLNAVREVRRSGPRLAACYACSYYAALRPEEAIDLQLSDLRLKDGDEWGEIALRRTAPHAGSEWTNSGAHRDERGLKHRAANAVRVVPISPELATILRAHLAQFGASDGGRLFRGERGEAVPAITYGRVWQRARALAFTPDVCASPLAATPYTLRHAAVSTWLNAGVPATQVAKWAGHSVEVLLKVYAKCLDRQDQVIRDRLRDALL
jgi:integrase